MAIFPEVSFVISCFNSNATIALALDSCLSQDYPNVSIFVADDGSFDNTPEILLSYLSGNPNLYLFMWPNMGFSASLNTLVSFVTAPYIARFDSDDVNYSYRISSSLSFLLDNNLDFAGSNVDFYDYFNQRQMLKSSVPLDKDSIIWSSCLKNPFNHPTMIIKTSLLKLYPYTSSFLFQPEDYWLWSKLIFKKYKFANLDLSLCRYTINSGSSMTNKFGVAIYLQILILRAYNFSRFIFHICFRNYSRK